MVEEEEGILEEEGMEGMKGLLLLLISSSSLP
jgi:hypothetical protein